MSADSESFNSELYNLLKVRGYRPTPLNSKNQRVDAAQAADVIEFTFKKDGKDYGKVWASIDDSKKVMVYFDDEQADSPSDVTPGVDYDDTWTGFLKYVKNWGQRRQLDFELSNKDHLGDDMRQRDYYKMKAKIAESYYSMGKKASYNDAVPDVKIIIQHSRALEEGEQRYRNIARIYLENVQGERFLAPTIRPGIARVYARHIAEGGVPNDERWNHVKGLCEEYTKMAGFVRATRNKQFNESAQSLVNEGINHYNNIRETLNRMTGHRGYSNYFESWTPALMEEEGDTTVNELFVQETLDPRIESVMPILSRLRKKVAEMAEVTALSEWADDIINEKLEIDEISKKLAHSYIKKAADPHEETGMATQAQRAGFELGKATDNFSASGEKEAKKTYNRAVGIGKAANILAKEDESSPKLKIGDKVVCDYTGEPMHVTYVHDASGKVKLANKKGEAQKNYRNPENLKKIEEVSEEESRTSNNPIGIPEGQDRPYVCVHVKKGKYEVKAGSSYEAAKKAAAKWGLKGTSGIDVHLADVTHTPVDEAMTKKQKEQQVRNFMSHDPEAGERILAMGKKDREENKAFKSGQSEINRLAKMEKMGKMSEADLTPVPSGHKGLNPQQKKAGQLGPTEPVGKDEKNLRGKLVGANESIDELAQITRMAGIKNTQK